MAVDSPAEQVLAGLDPEQRTAVTAAAGPVCILAGAGTGKTRAITHRIAYRTLRGDIAGRHLLAVTFTARAAAEMRARLAALGVAGVQARTFHAAAMRQVRYFAPRLLAGRELPELVASKARLVGLAAARVGVRTDRTGARDLASEIEWAKSSLVEPGEYVVAAAKSTRETPFEAAKVAEVFAAYEQLKRGNGVIDFEDLLRAAVWGIEEHSDVAEQVRAQYRHFVVDEYQDVNPLQQRLLDAWLGGRDDLTVVGDASQTIYSFTGATSAYLIDFPRKRSSAVVVRLVRDYRSTPQVVGLANAVIRQARGTEARLRLELVGQRPSGAEPELRIFQDEPGEAAAVSARCKQLIASGTPAREIAVLFRTNAQSETYEKALAEAEVPYVVQGAERFFERTEVRQALVALRAATRSTDPGEPLVRSVAAALEAVGWAPEQRPPGGAARERWEALAALVQVAEEFAATPVLLPIGEGAVSSRPPSLTDFVEELARRAAAQHAPTVDGVTLASLHSAKGLEWDAVFLVGLSDGTLPTTYAKTPEQVEEERRLLYVGVTRAREWLWLSYAISRSPGGRPRRPCRFLPQFDGRPGGGGGSAGATGVARLSRKTDSRPPRIVSCRVCGATLLGGADRKLGRCATCPSDLDEELLGRLQAWRARVSAGQRVPAYVVFTDATLVAIAERKPAQRSDLIAIAGIGPRKLGLYGDAALALVAGAAVDDLEPEKTSANDP
ncbi:DNA helicase [Asanoa ishikariensis]|uniref:DNA 3'-5' helicase n=1 Tax=Asanoa ishikariensis TaxID=137265 RepID=A0A1H3QX19_9ACTN|nr:ATP-dependent DNA helicase UvrD2 [Asanoa ishikariensis]GIF64610.1 DNA helicase [Asanoa ishikariensis]SDZ18084.1 ATP-dependent DNA helicase, Rep family [Asanoa ishikariensis]